MSRNQLMDNENYLEPMASYGNYPQSYNYNMQYNSPMPFNAQPQMMNPYVGQPSPMQGNGMFMYEPVPVKKHRRSAILFVILNILTLGIYGLVVMSHISQEINTIATDYDHKTTPFYCLAAFLSVITFGIYGIIYMNALSARIGRELRRRSIVYKFDEGSYWGWSIFGTLILIGPIIYLHKLFKAMKKLIEDYNVYG